MAEEIAVGMGMGMAMQFDLGNVPGSCPPYQGTVSHFASFVALAPILHLWGYNLNYFLDP